MTEEKRLIEVRIWMLRNNVTMEAIADDLGLTNTSGVTHWLNGEIKSRPMMAYLIGRGCPKFYFQDGRVVA